MSSFFALLAVIALCAAVTVGVAVVQCTRYALSPRGSYYPARYHLRRIAGWTAGLLGCLAVVGWCLSVAVAAAGR